MKIRSLALAVALLVTAAGCDNGDSPDRSIGRSPRPRTHEPGDPPVKIGLVGTMTGPEGWRGEDAFEGADLGVHILNRQIAGAGRDYELEVLDDGGNAATSLELVDDLLRRGDTVGIVFAGPPEALADAENVLRRNGVPAILCYGDLYGSEQLTSHVFQASPPYTWQARDLARYVARDRRYEKVGVLTEAGSLDGTSAASAAETALGGYRVDRVVRVMYQADVRAALERLRSHHVEAIVVEGAPSALERIYDEIAAMGARYRGTRAARIASLGKKKIRERRERRDWWHPQLLGFDLMINDRVDPPAPGSIAAASYSRGVHYLPIPSFEGFRDAFTDWWDAPPLGYEQRAYEATLALGWAAERAGEGDVARALESLRGRRFGGLPVTLGPDDHVTVEEVTIGLWTVPFEGEDTRENPPEVEPWVPLARGFSINGETTDVLTADWRWLFRKPPPRGGPAPPFERMRFGVTTSRNDPLR